jgi:hypothetical protein
VKRKEVLCVVFVLSASHTVPVGYSRRRAYSDPAEKAPRMGFWLGTLVFVILELIGYLAVKASIGARRGRPHELLGQVLLATTVVCCWLMWVIVYLGQMKPLVNPVLST